LTGHGQESDTRRSKEAGFEAHLVKPVDLDRLCELLQTRRSTGGADTGVGHVACRGPSYAVQQGATMSRDKQLDGLTVAILVSDLFEQAELTEPRRALDEAGARTVIVSDHGPMVHGMHHEKMADAFEVDVPLAQAQAADYDALLLPGGTLNADALRMVESAQRFVRAFDEASKPIGVICHGPWLLVSAGLVEGRTLTSWPSLQDDIRNAGGNWVDREVVVDANWISSRKPADLPAFNRELLEAVARAPDDVPAMPLAD
jgi:protease I